MFLSRREYERYIYTLTETFPSIKLSTLTLYMRSKTAGQLVGEICFESEIVISVLETIDFADGVIEDYSYEVYRRDEKLYWYDSWPHPQDASLSSTHPHHKHIPPDIKHNRITAPNLSFTEPNLPFLIREVEKLVSSSNLRVRADHGSRFTVGCSLTLNLTT